MKSSSSDSDSQTLGWGRGSEAGLFCPCFLVGNVMATFNPADLRPRLGVLVSTFWKKIRSGYGRPLEIHERFFAPKPRKLTIDSILLLIIISSDPLHVSSSEVTSDTAGFTAVFLGRPTLLFYRHSKVSQTLNFNAIRIRQIIIVTFIFTVLANPPSEPKLSQLSSEAEEEVSIWTSGTLRKLLKLLLLDGVGWTASFCKECHFLKYIYIDLKSKVLFKRCWFCFFGTKHW